jgi:2-keto-3-deoxy-galactonokinase
MTDLLKAATEYYQHGAITLHQFKTITLQIIPQLCDDELDEFVEGLVIVADIFAATER